MTRSLQKTVAGVRLPPRFLKLGSTFLALAALGLVGPRLVPAQEQKQEQ